jgi:hypothetical protein
MFRGEAITLWRAGRKETELHCFVVDEMPGGFWLGLEQAGALVLSETLPTVGDVVGRAEELRWTFARRPLNSW